MCKRYYVGKTCPVTYKAEVPVKRSLLEVLLCKKPQNEVEESKLFIFRWVEIDFCEYTRLKSLSLPELSFKTRPSEEDEAFIKEVFRRT